jgi:hypothetical protein
VLTLCRFDRYCKVVSRCQSANTLFLFYAFDCIASNIDMRIFCRNVCVSYRQHVAHASKKSVCDVIVCVCRCRHVQRECSQKTKHFAPTSECDLLHAAVIFRSCEVRDRNERGEKRATQDTQESRKCHRCHAAGNVAASRTSNQQDTLWICVWCIVALPCRRLSWDASQICEHYFLQKLLGEKHT